MKSFSLKIQTTIFILAGNVLISCNNKAQTDQTKEKISTLSSDSPQVQGKAVKINSRIAAI